MEHFIKLWTILAVLTIYSCNSKENRKEVATDNVQKEKAVDTVTNNNGVVIPKEIKIIEETEVDNSFTVSDQTDLNGEIKIAFNGDYRKADNKDYLISENGNQWFGVFSNVDAPRGYTIISTVIHIKDTIREDDAISPDHIIISTDDNKDKWNNCLFLFKGIKVSLKQEKKQSTNYASPEGLRMYPGEVLYDINFNGHDYFDLYAQGSVIFDTSEHPRNTGCQPDYGDQGVNINDYSIILVRNHYQEETNSWKGQKYVLLQSGAICSSTMPGISFIGDIDGDDIPDFIIEHSYKMSSSKGLYLSSKDFKEVAYFEESYGC